MVGSIEKGDDLESVQELLALSSLLDTIGKIDLKEVEAAVEAQLLPVDKMVRDLKAHKQIARVVKGKGRYKANLHWKTKAAKRRKYYAMIGAPKRKERLAEMISTPEGWFDYLTQQDKTRGRNLFKITREEWNEHVAPELKGRLPIIRRYNTRKPVTLENCYIVDQDNPKDVIWEGSEYRMRRLGYIL